MLRVSESLSLPPEAVTQTFAILAKRGVGKTYTAAVMVEEMVKAQLPVAVVDPIGVWWGLRTAADGGPGLPVIILGGEHGDLPLAVEQGSAVAEMLIAERVPVVLDLGLFRKNEQVRFMTDFAETLYQKNRAALHIVLDEADAFAPQRPLPGHQRLLGAIEDIVRRGRARGLGATLITQRPAVLNKDVLTQIEVLVVMRTIGPQDRNAIDDWIKVHGEPGQREELMASLPSLPIGTAWFWSPGWLDLFQKVQVRQRETADSSATPKVGERIEAGALAPVDLERLSAYFAKPQIVSTKKRNAPVEKIIERIEVPMLNDGDRDLLIKVAAELSALGQGIANLLHRFTPLDQDRPTVRPNRKVEVSVITPPVNGTKPAIEGAFPIAKRKVLTALAQHGDLTKKQLAILTGYAIKGGGFNNTLGALRSHQWIEGRDPIQITSEGRLALGESWEPLPQGEALRDWWMGQLPRAERLILETLYAAYPQVLTKETLAEQTGYAANGGGYNNALGKLRTLELIEGRAELKASEALF